MQRLLILLLLAAPGLAQDDGALGDLIGELVDRDAYVRTVARERILALGVDAAPALVEALGAPDARLRAEAARVLGSMEKAAVSTVPALEVALDDPIPEVRVAALGALAAIDPVRTVIRSGKELVQPGREDALMRALSGLMIIEKIEPEEIVRFLVPLLGNRDRGIRIAVARVLGGIGPDAAAAIGPLIELGRSADWGLRFAAHDALAGIGTAAAAPLIASLAQPDGAVRAWAPGVFARLGPRTLTAGLQTLSSEDKRLRAAGADALGAAGAGAAVAVPKLIETLHDPAGVVRRAAANALAAIGRPAEGAIPALVMLAGDPERRARLHAVRALGSILCDGARGVQTGARLGTQEERAAITGALQWLVSGQEKDGRWDCDAHGGRAHYDTGVTGLAILALLRDGPEETHDGAIEAGLRYLVTRQDAEGCFDRRSSAHFAYGHAIATAAMCEAYSRRRDPLWGAAARRGLDFVAAMRHPEGAWRYEPRDPESDTSVTGWMVIALHAGVMAGLDVDRQAFAGALRYLDRVTNPETGRAGYDLKTRFAARPADMVQRFPVDHTRSMTAAALLARLHCGGSGPLLDKPAAEILRVPPVWDVGQGRLDMYYWLQAPNAYPKHTLKHTP